MTNAELTGTPTLSEFNPSIIPFQYEVIFDVRQRFDYSLGCHEILCSGAVGSAKTLLGAHLAITHCMMNPFAKILIGRKTRSSLKETLLQKILDHMGSELTFSHNKSRDTIEFSNGSKMLPYSWADGKIKKVRSLEITAAIIEELTENDNMKFYEEIVMRVGRTKHCREKFVLSLTNPDEPTHPAYKYFFLEKSPTRHVYLSKTRDNPFLDDAYIQKLESILDPKMARRMLHGEWLSIMQEVIYYSYDRDKNFREGRTYEVSPNHPLHLSFDFNIGEGKPLSAVLFQYIDRVFHVFAEIVIHGSRTEDVMDEAAGRGYLDHPGEIIINGDATGKHRDTRSKHSDYQIIKMKLDNHLKRDGSRIRWVMDVPLANPKVRERHNIMNGQLCNSKGHRSILVYPTAPTVDEAMRLTKLKPASGYVEDDSKAFQHIGTALGYGVVATLRHEKNLPITALRR